MVVRSATMSPLSKIKKFSCCAGSVLTGFRSDDEKEVQEVFVGIYSSDIGSVTPWSIGGGVGLGVDGSGLMPGHDVSRHVASRPSQVTDGLSVCHVTRSAEGGREGEGEGGGSK